MRCKIILKFKHRRRYIGFYIDNLDKKNVFKKFDLIDEIKNKCIEIYGSNPKSMGIFVIKFDGYKGIVKCNHIKKDETIKILNSINKLSDIKVKIITVGTSGTIKKLIIKHMNKLIIFL